MCNPTTIVILIFWILIIDLVTQMLTYFISV